MAEEESLDIIVAGLPRTGTMSLKAALEILGFGPCHHLLEPTFQISRLHRSAAALEEKDPQRRAKAFKDLYAGYKVALDLPGTACVDELSQIYPEAKVILTIRRDASLWLDSIKGLGFDVTTLWFRLVCFWVPGVISSSNMTRSWHDCCRTRFELQHIPSVELYKAHNDFVRKVIPPASLLEFDPSMGWEPLCTFLGKDIPDVPFPRRNDRTYLRNGLRAAVVTGVLVWLAIAWILRLYLKYLVDRFYLNI
ncbi:hypothetical protein JX265_005060 [Neoarthrinium moseri]|uniref:P-loop containing nucleoside triphosphate hydrolase protein n=1 Tax=Neoarthrinium moseri TaxID=1658444 RepID=A0A9P9WPM6_9PEZI|nr:uncharacterized protein JN550_009217 [Neoarthrinium moseri]KAI1842733.1 hypothetical protein JX266_011054 [Neoarthrinium moseri]KAI1863938.1 hypothetical protein JN550_009217 [Neoarthrinium moseri]KAI1873438.1 hypothetical protein JX265_005060 [Neoarthrinium moseri]